MTVDMRLMIMQDVVLNLDWSNTLYTAQGLMEIQQLFGPVPVLKGIGAAAEAVANNLSRLIETAEAGVSPLGMPLCLSCFSCGLKWWRQNMLATTLTIKRAFTEIGLVLKT